MPGELAAWFAAERKRSEDAGQWSGMTALARKAGIDRQVLYDIQNGRRASQEKVSRIAAAFGVDAPRVGAVVAQTGVSAAAVATLRAATSELRSVAERLERVERELTGGPSDAQRAKAAAVKAKRASDRAQRRRGDGGGSRSA